MWECVRYVLSMAVYKCTVRTNKSGSEKELMMLYYVRNPSLYVYAHIKHKWIVVGLCVLCAATIIQCTSKLYIYNT